MEYRLDEYNPDTFEIDTHAVYHPVNKPGHYNLNEYGIEAIDAIKAATCDAKGEEAVYQANIIKYIWRYRRKNGLEDLKKAKWYLEGLIELYETGRYKDSKIK